MAIFIHSSPLHITHAYAHLTHTPSQLLPLLLESLQCNEAGLRVSTLEGLLSLLHDAPQVVSEHVPSLVPRLLELARAPESMVAFVCAVQLCTLMAV